MKAKNGQILVLVLILMAVGLIIMSPLLRYLNNSYNIYNIKLENTLAYYTVDAMIGKIFSDMYAGENVYTLNKSDYSRYNNKSAGGWLNGFYISTVINNSMPSPPPSGDGTDSGFIYTDPGCAFGLNSLAYNATHSFNVSLTEGAAVTVNWYFRDQKASLACSYYCVGRMWISNQSATVCGSSTADLSNGRNAAFQQQLNWTVPQNGSGYYYINFQNRAVRGQGGGCTNVSRSMSQMLVKPTFSGVGDLDHTWVRTGNISGSYQDYTITTTATLASTNTRIATITACVRQTPGPGKWWDQQSLAVVTWTIEYY